MLRKVLGASLLGLVLMPAIARAEFKQGDFDVTIGGAGANGPNFDGFSASANGQLGYFVTDQVELGIRQSLTYTDIATTGGGDLNGSTRAFADFNFDLGHVAFVPDLVAYAGANIGYVYGQPVRDQWEAAPEAGLKFFVNSSTYIYTSAEYQFFFRRNSNSSAFSDGQFLYGLGIGFRF